MSHDGSLHRRPAAAKRIHVDDWSRGANDWWRGVKT
jgi:hypothetical protein